jgi:hypothetical protein
MSQTGYGGNQSVTVADQYNHIKFIVQNILSQVATTKLVQVISCTNSGGDSPVGTVNIIPIVSQVDGFNNTYPHGTIFQVPYVRVQGGTNAIILDPQPGDIGIAVFADRDSSNVATNSAAIQSNPLYVAGGAFQPPGSGRRFDMQDALYIGGVLNGTPTQFVEFSSSGITVTTPGTVTINAATVVVNAANSATVKAPNISLENAGTALQSLLTSAFMTWAESHQHSNGNGGANTGGPTSTPPANSQTSIVKAE